MQQQHCIHLKGGRVCESPACAMVHGAALCHEHAYARLHYKGIEEVCGANFVAEEKKVEPIIEY